MMRAAMPNSTACWRCNRTGRTKTSAIPSAMYQTDVETASVEPNGNGDRAIVKNKSVEAIVFEGARSSKFTVLHHQNAPLNRSLRPFEHHIRKTMVAAIMEPA